jgi:nucleotide-binding universal stress UspA family protein
MPADDVTLESAARRLLDAAVAGVDARGVRVERVLARGMPASALLDAARDADLLVLGIGTHPGGVLRQVLPHAPCPVVVVGADSA